MSRQGFATQLTYLLTEQLPIVGQTPESGEKSRISGQGKEDACYEKGERKADGKGECGS